MMEEYQYHTITTICRYGFGRAKGYNMEREHYFPLCAELLEWQDQLPDFGHVFELTMKYKIDKEGEIIGRPIKYAIPVTTFKRIR